MKGGHKQIVTPCQSYIHMNLSNSEFLMLLNLSLLQMGLIIGRERYLAIPPLLSNVLQLVVR